MTAMHQIAYYAFTATALVNCCKAAGWVVKSKEVKQETVDAYVENLPLHEQSSVGS